MTYPQTPEIIAGGNGCAFRWNAEKLIFAILKRKNAMQSANLLHSIFHFSRLPGVSHKFCDISLWATAIVTNSLAIAQIVSETNHELLFAGGKLQKQGKSFVGPFTTAIIDSIVIDTAFMSSDGFMDGPTTFSHEEMEVKKHVINRSTQKILLSDSSKFSKHSTYIFAKCSDYDYLICDDIKNQDKKRIEGIKSIIIAET